MCIASQIKTIRDEARYCLGIVGIKILNLKINANSNKTIECFPYDYYSKNNDCKLLRTDISMNVNCRQATEPGTWIDVTWAITSFE